MHPRGFSTVLALIGPPVLAFVGSTIYALQVVACPDEWPAWIAASTGTLAWLGSVPLGLLLGAWGKLRPHAPLSKPRRLMALACCGASATLLGTIGATAEWGDPRYIPYFAGEAALALVVALLLALQERRAAKRSS